MVRALRWGTAVLLTAALGGFGCDATGPVPDFDETPTVALLITPVPPVPLDSGLFATLVTTGTPIRSPYLRAERFEMRRLSDGARFDWRAVDTPTDAVPVLRPLARGNYFLPRRSGTGGLGSDSIVEGAVYELVAQAGPHQIVGRTRVPGKIEFVREPADGDSIVRWRRDPNAARYAAEYAFDGYLLLASIEDTAIVVRRAPAFPGQLEPMTPTRVIARVIALDSNYAAFRSDVRVERAGITGAWGVFGSFTWAHATLTYRKVSTDPP
jgi:hypothetical protein